MLTSKSTTQINEVNSVQALRDVAGENFDALVASGFAKPTSTLSLDDKCIILHTLCLHHTLLVCKAETDQFIEGLKSLGVLDSIRKHMTMLKPFFCIEQRRVHLTAGNL